ncbi:DExH-box ATP-dependent RNA helicase DExH12-like [Prunus yedoensis var. nudiflora]|uniref:DExH-box ATP-dependent RNA helicase DExH12-like n=1 Tax=Prunus yedoensis var. nudiflora TaxID=2094558 RepID=A0A314YZA1_PRUYE|nr:DExH-box ATP-dependent RNA helicase DExH12-like [Prunus yedoensis var. nudiflora]
MVERRMWGVQTPLRQFNVLTVKLEKKDLDWERYFDLSPQELGQLIHMPKMGRILHKWLRSETVLPVSFKHLMLPEKNPPPTELLDLQPLPVAALRNPLYEALYDHDFKCFNPIQTRVFTVLYNSDDNVLVAAPTGSGKTLCADIAVLRNHQKGTQSDSHAMRVVYMAPSEALANERYRDWERKFGKGLKLCVGKLIGERSRDLKQLQKCHIIISTPENWDALSRRWKQNKNVQQVSLFIVDELHLIGGQGGPVLEAIVSRMRYISSQTENKIRIVALSTSLANAKDLGEWIGATSHGLFNFPPGARPVPLEIHIQGVEYADFEARMQAMMKPTYTAIVQHAKNAKPALVYVPTNKHIRLTAENLVPCSYADSGEKPPLLLRPLDGHIESLIGRLNDEILQSILRGGVGYLHEGLTLSDQQIVSRLFEDGWIQVCVVSSSMCWGVSLFAHLVVVMGTQYYDSRENVHTDYHVTELLQMMAHANRPLLDDSGKCVILCHAPRKEYYKKFLYEALPVESHLHHYLHDNLNAEIVNGIIRSKQDAVDHLTWTFLYRRLTQNPNYYNLQGVSQRHLSEHLSELVETTLSDLEASQCIAIDDDMKLSPLVLGLVASYFLHQLFYRRAFRILFNSPNKDEGSCGDSSSSFRVFTASYTIRGGRGGPKNPKCTDPHVKANALLQAHFSRQLVGENLILDQQEVILSASRLVPAMVDIICNHGWLSLAILVMELSQMVTQGVWHSDSELLQLPHFTEELAKRCQENPGKSVEKVFDLKGMEADERRKLLEMSDTQMVDVERFCNRFPEIGLECEVVECGSAKPGEDERITLQVTLRRELDGGRTEVGPVDALRYPKTKEEGWWLVVGDTKTDSVLAIKKVCLQNQANAKLEFDAPAAAEAGKKTCTLYLMSDSYMGCDQEIQVDIN